MKTAALFTCALMLLGCTQHRLITDSSRPEIELDRWGMVSFRGERIEFGEVAETLRDAGFENDTEVNILVPDNPPRDKMAHLVGQLGKAGFTRAIFVKKRVAKSEVGTEFPNAQNNTSKGKARSK